MTPTQLKTRAIMFSDIKGYSLMMGEDEDKAMVLLEEHNAIVVPCIERHEGKVLKYIGDAVLSTYESASDAVRAGIEIQQSLAERNRGKAESERILIRIGIHIGDVILKGGDVFGDGVNVASRIEPLAEPGGICISQTVYDMVRARPEIHTANLGPKELKNIKEAINIYKVLVEAEDTSPYLSRPGKGEYEEPGPSKEKGTSTDSPARLAVLYFKNTGSGEDDYFSDGIAEDLMNDLSRIGALRVASAKNVERFKGSNLSIGEIGRQLQVDAVLEGNIRRAGNRARINAQLISVADGFHLWAERFDVTLDDIFAVQDEVTKKIVEALKVTLTPKDEKIISEKYTPSKEAHDLYLRGMYHVKRFSLEDEKKAVELLEQAVRKDERYALAYAGLSHAYRAKCVFIHLVEGTRDEKLLDKAMEAARKSVTLDDSLPETHAALGRMLMMQSHDNEAVDEFEKALTLRPHSAEVHNFMAKLYAFNINDYERALGFALKAVELEPTEIDAWLVLGGIYRFRNEFQKSLAAISRAQALRPDHTMPYYHLGLAYLHQKNYPKAEEALQKAIAIEPTASLSHAVLGKVFEMQGKYGKAGVQYERAIALEASSLAYHLSYAIVLQKDGKMEKAATFIENLANHLDSVNSPEWAKSLVRYYAGQISEADLLKRIKTEKRSYEFTPEEGECDAYYFMGMKKNLVDGDKAMASEYLKKCLATNAQRILTLMDVEGELERLNREDAS